ncbi:MAG TPA: tRNA (adenosine(37)-N6)-threonylcarbamoyltransferase complex ATPase subunit type 1 TsaE, partial [Gemmatimonadetes bacterium]|nr:tRNA (adenosine(37)-N6)-threonylcarbamoyltransferase complex ATPase subunit type 1 TsaE [Gemmatimonadota bacterium]
GAGVQVAMPSPSFNLVFRYEADGGREVVHLDLYRIESPDDLWELGWNELGAENEIIIVEWPEQARALMPPDHWLIHLTVVSGSIELRDVRVQKVGSPNELVAFPISSSDC